MLRALTHATAQYGVAPAELLERAALPERALGDDAYRMSFVEEERLFSVVLDVTDDPAFGLAWARRTHFTAWGTVSLVLAYSPTLREVFGAIGRYAPIFCGGFDITLHEHGEEAAIRFELPARTARVCVKVYSEVFMAGMVRLLGNHFPSRFRGARFGYGAPEDTAEYQAVFGKELRFDAPHTEFAVAREALERPLRMNASDFVARAVRNEAEGLLEKQNACRSLAWRVRRYLAASELGATDMTGAARSLGLSIRSLRRRLSEEGSSWTALLHEEWAARAERLLARLTIQETAYELGFADSSAFHRAFKKWTGRTPAAFQRSRRSSVA